jgi:predicted transcriptional regulator
MTTLTITIPDQTAALLTDRAKETGRSVDDVVTEVVNDALDDSWLEDLSPADRAAIEEGLAQAERGETIPPHEEVMAEMKRKFGW